MATVAEVAGAPELERGARVASAPTSVRKVRALPAREIALALIWSLAVPLFIYISLGVISMHALALMLAFVATCYIGTAAGLIFEGALAWRRRTFVGAVGGAVERPVTAVVVAYLPNEQDIIVDTVRHLLTALDVPAERLQVVLAYNTPEPLPVENELRRIARADPRFVALKVAGSHTKAENLNAALPCITGEVTAIFDADHRPAPNCFANALRWFDRGYDVVQGRCTVRNGNDNWLTRMVRIEFATMYAVAHAARSVAVDTALFGGSNGYWRTTLLRSMGMNAEMLTEDIDATLRALLDGARIVHDRSVIATELAPVAARDWFFQRLRWAQGWYQVTRTYTRAVTGSTRLDGRQKAYWLYLLAWRESFALIATQAMPIFLAMASVQLFFHIPWHWNAYLTSTTALTLAGGLLTTLSAVRNAVPHERPSKLDVAVFLLATPLYSQLKNTISLVSWVREWRHAHEWIPTPRSGGSG
jgi:cellulose synthase/poly-beta-1,6-N-acetylglucosamine synthase-like glycosyltransferase